MPSSARNEHNHIFHTQREKREKRYKTLVQKLFFTQNTAAQKCVFQNDQLERTHVEIFDKSKKSFELKHWQNQKKKHTEPLEKN